MAALETLCGRVISNCLSFICSARKQVGIGFHSPLSVRPSVVRCPVLHLLQEKWDRGGQALWLQFLQHYSLDSGERLCPFLLQDGRGNGAVKKIRGVAGIRGMAVPVLRQETIASCVRALCPCSA